MTDAALPNTPLSGKTLRELRARAHALKPVVWISDNGATETVMREIDRSLRAHELIKIHAAVDGRRERETVMDEICTLLAAHPVQIIGKMLVVFRPQPEEPQPAPVAAKSAPRKRAPNPGSARKPTVNSKRSAAGKPEPGMRKR